ncbi:ABC transporter ATP-binding protein [Defluviimonas sp. SAOS-178_SWC]|uniref:ABC transporter ATP-binding protein n=1 Tax=Defluviimonas sp. SAOS-178_SWC TaxID=3121287 RepID=UPI0032220EA2
MASGAERVALTSVTKAFGDIVAIRSASLSVNYGEVHALIGENGAGKSTLMRILAGHMAADQGSLVFEGKSTPINRRILGHRAGVGFVEQEGGLIEELTGAENFVLAQGKGLIADRRGAISMIQSLARRFGGEIDLNVPIYSLPMGQRQRLEILIVLALGANVLILDEPTASLAEEDSRTLSQIIRTFVGDGGSVIYISHKLHEVKEIADRITVMRRGEVVGCHDARSVTVNQLATEMVGDITPLDRRADRKGAQIASDELLDVALGAHPSVHHRESARAACVLESVSARSPYKSEANLADVSLNVNAGEIVGIAGVVGSGQTVLAEVLAGILMHTGGTVHRPSGAIAYVPENRHRDAVALHMSIRDNLMVHLHSKPEYASGLWPRRGAMNTKAGQMLLSSRVVGARIEAPVASLSGGNQQKLVLGRELEQNPSLVVAHNPFRGLDVRAIRDVKDALIGACDAGAGVIMISSDLDEILQLADRVVVLFSGRVMGSVVIDSGDLDAIGKMMGGISQ